MLLVRPEAINSLKVSASATGTQIADDVRKRPASRQQCLCFRAETASDAVRWVRSLTAAVDKVLTTGQRNRNDVTKEKCDSLFRHLVQHRGSVDYMGQLTSQHVLSKGRMRNCCM